MAAHVALAAEGGRMSFEIGDAATWLAAAVAVYSAIAARQSSRAADRHQEEAAADARRAADLLERSWVDQHSAAVREWADKVCRALSEARHLAEQDKLDAQAKHQLLVTLSHLADTGRWHFPNDWFEEVGVEKELAYRGYRRPVLDCVLDAYEAVKRSKDSGSLSKALIGFQRDFVSHIQEALDPRSREAEIRRLRGEGAVDSSPR